MESVIIGCCIHYEVEGLEEINSNRNRNHHGVRKKKQLRRNGRRYSPSPSPSLYLSPPPPPPPGSRRSSHLRRFRGDAFKMHPDHPNNILRDVIVSPELGDAEDLVLNRYLIDAIEQFHSHDWPEGTPEVGDNFMINRYLMGAIELDESHGWPQPSPPGSPQLGTPSPPDTPSTPSPIVSSTSTSPSPSPSPAYSSTFPLPSKVYSEPAIALNIPSGVPSRAALTSTSGTTSERDQVKRMVNRKRRWHFKRNLAATEFNCFRTAKA